MEGLDELLERVEEKAYTITGLTEVEVIEIKDLIQIVNEIKKEIIEEYT